MENYNTHLAPGFTLNDLAPAPVNVAAFRGLLGSGGFNSLYQMSFQHWNRFSPYGLRTSWTPCRSWGFSFPTRAPPAFALPLFTVLMEFKPSPFSLFSLVPVAVYNFLLSLQLLLGRGACSVSPCLPSLCPLSTRISGSLPIAASRSPTSALCATYLLNSVVQFVQIVVLILQSVF